MSNYDDPFGSFNFHVEIDGEDNIAAYFNEVSGLKGQVEEFEIKEGGVNDRTHKFPGRVTWGPVTLKRGIDTDQAIYNWWRQVVENNKGGGQRKLRRKVRIVLLDDEFNEERSWTIQEAWPMSWEGPSLNSSGSELAFESVTLNHSGVTES